MRGSAIGLSLLAFAWFPVLGGVPASADDPPKSAEGSAKKVAVSIRFLTELNIAQLTLDVEPLSVWLKPVIADLETRFRDETAKRTVIVQVTLHPQGPAEVLVAGKPALSEEETKAILRAADIAKTPHGKVVDCSLRVEAQINGGHPDEALALSPAIRTPDERRFEAFRAASTAERLALMRTWARTEALPILAATATGVDPKFQGVRNLGRSITNLAPDAPFDVAGLTDRNPDYWRALVEMAPGQPLVPTIRAALLVANGEMDHARIMVQVLSFFDNRKTGPSRLLAELQAMLSIFFKDIETKIQEGIALHDRERFDEALKAYEAILKDYPKSAWAHYERFQTRRGIVFKRKAPLDEVEADWPQVRKSILDSNPLYTTMARASGNDEWFRFMRRTEINELFKDRAKAGKDVVRYADIALDLDVDPIAALIYWNALTSIRPEDYDNRPLLEYFLYSVDRLGNKDLKENFRGDHAAEFARITEERRKLREKITVLEKDAEPDAKERKPKPD